MQQRFPSGNSDVVSEVIHDHADIGQYLATSLLELRDEFLLLLDDSLQVRRVELLIEAVISCFRTFLAKSLTVVHTGSKLIDGLHT